FKFRSKSLVAHCTSSYAQIIGPKCLPEPGKSKKLGALPIVIALFLQFKDMHWPPHPSWVEIFLIFVSAFGYWQSVTQISVRLRLQLYETLLRKALT
ncbi:hypothetical protein HDE77_001353, partial [Rhodanobacter sp. MP7CTX1]|nr:hypothetical protein [Rhodanobacter sp. MP7CTX1]